MGELAQYELVGDIYVDDAIIEAGTVIETDMVPNTDMIPRNAIARQKMKEFEASLTTRESLDEQVFRQMQDRPKHDHMVPPTPTAMPIRETAEPIPATGYLPSDSIPRMTAQKPKQAMNKGTAAEHGVVKAKRVFGAGVQETHSA